MGERGSPPGERGSPPRERGSRVNVVHPPAHLDPPRTWFTGERGSPPIGCDIDFSNPHSGQPMALRGRRR